jgi:hypothetical protein
MDSAKTKGLPPCFKHDGKLLNRLEVTLLMAHNRWVSRHVKRKGKIVWYEGSYRNCLGEWVNIPGTYAVRRDATNDAKLAHERCLEDYLLKYDVRGGEFDHR